MDIRLLSLMGIIVLAVIFFLLGRRTSPGGRALHRLQLEVDAKNAELTRYKEQMTQFLKEVRGEMSRLSVAHHDLEERLLIGAKSLSVKLPEKSPTIDATDRLGTDWQAPKRKAVSGTDRDAAMAAACPIPSEPSLMMVPKDYAAFEDEGDTAAA